MDLKFNTILANNYTSPSQKVRVLTESWVLDEIFCPSCGGTISGYGNNKPVADFYCTKCIEDFELKSKKGNIGKKVPAGAYSQMIERISSPHKPNFFFLGYIIESWSVHDFFVVPKHFFMPDIIERRKALSMNAERAGWVGSNILFSKIPKAGQIFYIENGKEIQKKDVLEKWQKTIFLKSVKKVETRDWIIDTMNCVDSLDKKEFSLRDMYAFEKDLSTVHPKNKNIKPKIRQQLQFLRDKGYLKFLGNGVYRLV